MHRRRKHINANFRHPRIRRAAILEEQAVLLPFWVAGRGGVRGGRIHGAGGKFGEE